MQVGLVKKVLKQDNKHLTLPNVHVYDTQCTSTTLIHFEHYDTVMHLV